MRIAELERQATAAAAAAQATAQELEATRSARLAAEQAAALANQKAEEIDIAPLDEFFRRTAGF